MIPMPTTDLEFRFWEKVAYIGAGEDDCWEWRAARNPSGHGRFSIEHRRGFKRVAVPAHVFSYEQLVAPVPEDKPHLDHLCCNPWCVNPKHLEPVTLWENLRRSPKTPARINSEKTHCPQGHPFDEENTCVSGGSRYCRACARAAAARRYRQGGKERMQAYRKRRAGA